MTHPLAAPGLGSQAITNPTHMLYVDIPTTAELHDLALERTPGSVSIFLPTTPVSIEISSSRIALKNLSKEALAQLEAVGHDKREIAAIEAHLEDIIDDDTFWRFQAHSLAIFAKASGVKTYRVPNTLSPLAEVADRFYLKPLFRTVSFANTAYVLALAEGNVRLLEISPDLPVTTVSISDLPENAMEALGVSSLGVKTESRRTDSSAGQRGLRTQFSRLIDRALRKELAGQNVPLFLAADVTLGGLYRSINSYPHLASFGIDRTPEKMSESEIAAEARTLLDRLNAEKVAAARGLFDARNSSGRATTDIAQAAKAATMGAIDTIMVDMDAVVPGLIDEESGAVTFADTETADNYGVVDEIARRALLTGATVLAVRKEDLPGATPVAAILRYAV